jgi:aryl-alcohol dehydrogenase-like predicted oxidoreductase
MTNVAPRFIGDRPVFPIALGGASWSFTDHPLWGNIRPPDDELALRAIHAALDAGMTLIDTARAYTTVDHPGHSQALIARALASHPAGSQVMVATKGGHYRKGNSFPNDASPDAIRRDCESSLCLLGVDCIDLYQLHTPDPEVPIATTMSAFAELRDEGLIRYVGVSGVSLAQLEEAASVVPITSVQNMFSPFRQDDRPMLDYCTEHSIAYLAHSPLSGGGGLLGGQAHLSEAFPAAAAIAERQNISVQRLALAWLLTLSPVIIPITGASKPATIRDSALAARINLTDDDLSELDFGDRELAAVRRVQAQLDGRLQEIAAAIYADDTVD